MYLNSILLEPSDAEDVKMRDCVPLGLNVRPSFDFNNAFDVKTEKGKQ